MLDKRFSLLTELIGKAVSDLSTRLKAVEDQPQPLPFAMTSRSVAKSPDGMTDTEALLADPSLLSLLAIKLAQRQGR